ncbi:MAG TPA: TIGR04168 family protein, partial [Allocoleopsis sp.]
DVHEQWDKDDAKALESLGLDLVLFVGDFGNESIPTVSAIASLNIPKATVFGNHDCWYSGTSWGKKKRPNDYKEGKVQQQINILGEDNVSYGKKDFPELELTVVGSRPFTWGGTEWKMKDFYQEQFGVSGFNESTDQILTSVKLARYNTIIFLGHNGPQGLGNLPESICGKDWEPRGGDMGDPDFQEAIAQTLSMGKNVPLVAFGHFHHHLKHTKERLREQIVINEKTVYLNAARTPRIIQNSPEKMRNFSLVSLQNGKVTKADLIWIGKDEKIISLESLYQRE